MKTIELKIYAKIYKKINYLEYNNQLLSFIFNQCCFLVHQTSNTLEKQ